VRDFQEFKAGQKCHELILRSEDHEKLATRVLTGGRMLAGLPNKL
jgi:hypothetical protein